MQVSQAEYERLSAEAKVLDERWTAQGNIHPTVKPIALMKRLLEGCDGVVLDPFLGSGTTGCAAAYMPELKFTGIDMTEEYIKIATSRVDFHKKQQWESTRQLLLFDL